MRQHRMAALIVAALAPLTWIPQHALAQKAKRCCLPNGTCSVLTAFDCGQAGGVYDDNYGACDPTSCIGKHHPGVGMSRAAARRMLREGVVHTVWWYPACGHENDLFTQPETNGLWQLTGSHGLIFAPQIRIDLRWNGRSPEACRGANWDLSNFQTHAASVAADLAAQVASAKAAFDLAHSNDGAVFNWSVRFEALGTANDWQVGPGVLPCFTNHAEDVATGKLPKRRYIAQGGRIAATGTDPGTGAPTIDIVDADYQSAFFQQFPADYYTAPSNATINIGADETPQTRTIVGYDPVNNRLTLDVAFSGNVVNSWFGISRSEPSPSGNVWPCYFFKEGAEEVEEWVIAFKNAMAAEMAAQSWPAGVGDPVAVIVADEDINGAGVFGEEANYWQYYNDNRANPEHPDSVGHTIDGERTLQEWHTDMAKYRSGQAITDFTTSVTYSPADQERRSYLSLTMTTAYNYWREQSTWQHLRALWPKAHLSQYILGGGYGVTNGNIANPAHRIEVPIGPGAANYHGVPTWKGAVAWEAYACITNPAIPFQTAADGGIIPVFYPSAEEFKAGEVVSFNDQFTDEIVVSSVGDAMYWVGGNYGVFIQFTSGFNNTRIIRIDSATELNTGAYALKLEDDLWVAGAGDPIEDDTFAIIYPNLPGAQALAPQNPILWPLMETFCNRYGELLGADGFQATGIKWAAEQARAHTRALPDNPYTVYLGPEGADGYFEQVAFRAYYPHRELGPMFCEDGWMGVDEWWRIGMQAADYGVNDFVWFTPVLNNDQASLDLVYQVIAAMSYTIYHRRMNEYSQVACIADWDENGEVDGLDRNLFGAEWMSGSNPETDLDNDGILIMDEDDMTIFEAAYNAGDCGDVDIEPPPEGCDADWCEDGSKTVADIFCFLADWFALEPDARTYGGAATPVQAIFTWLAVWFATPSGPCTP